MRRRFPTVILCGVRRFVCVALVGLGSVALTEAQAQSPSPALASSAQPAASATEVGTTNPTHPTPSGGATTSPTASATIQDPNVKPASSTSYVPLQQPLLGEKSNGYPSSDTQDVPGATEYPPGSYGFATRLPAYYFEPSYYNTPWVGARPFADYAPPGYEEEREVQDAPGNPVFVRLTPPPRDRLERRIILLPEE